MNETRDGYDVVGRGLRLVVRSLLIALCALSLAMAGCDGPPSEAGNDDQERSEASQPDRQGQASGGGGVDDPAAAYAEPDGLAGGAFGGFDPESVDEEMIRGLRERFGDLDDETAAELEEFFADFDEHAWAAEMEQALEDYDDEELARELDQAFANVDVDVWLARLEAEFGEVDAQTEAELRALFEEISVLEDEELEMLRLELRRELGQH